MAKQGTKKGGKFRGIVMALPPEARETLARGLARERAKREAREKLRLQSESREPAKRLPIGERDGNAYYSQKAWESAEEKGKPFFTLPLRYIHAPKAGRPPLPAIRAWLAKRKNVRHWRNRDGSYSAVASFKGPRAWDMAQRAAMTAPMPGYLAFRYLARPEIGKDRTKRANYVVQGITKDADLMPLSTRVSLIDNWVHAFSDIFKAYVPHDTDERYRAGVYLKRAGLALHWPGPEEREGKGKRRARNEPPKKRGKGKKRRARNG